MPTGTYQRAYPGRELLFLPNIMMRLIFIIAVFGTAFFVALLFGIYCAINA